MYNGVKQGGVLSATLFCLYMDELMLRLEASGVGCYIGNKFYGGLSYADDLKLLSPSVYGLQKLLQICEDFGNEYSVKYNAKKTVCICYGISDSSVCDIRRLRINGTHIIWQTRVKYLGNIHVSDMSDNYDIDYKKGVYISAVNKVNHQFSLAPSRVKAFLLQTYCSAWYGSQTWPLHTAAVKRFNTQWNKAVRKTMNIPYRTRTKLLPYLADNENFQRQIEKRFLRMFQGMLNSKNSKISYIAHKSTTNSYGVLGQNRIFLMRKYDLYSLETVTNLPPACLETDEILLSRVSQIKELLSARDGHSSIDVLNGEIVPAINYLCTY